MEMLFLFLQKMQNKQTSISMKSSTNPESFSGFGRDRRIDWRDPMDTPKALFDSIRDFMRKIPCK